MFEHIRHPSARPGINFTGIVGVYLGSWAETEHAVWLYVPCLILLLGCDGSSAPFFPAIKVQRR